MLALILSSVLAFAAPAAEPSVYSAILKGQATKKIPLGGSFSEGEKMFRTANPLTEADAAFESSNAQYIRVCGFACVAVGVSDIAGADSGPQIPATSDTLSAVNKGYNQAATDFALTFNQRLKKRLEENGASAATAPTSTSSAEVAKPAELIHSAMSDKDLSINGVTIGKSNLYNATGKFGTNMFKKEEGGLFIICWKGADGTTLAFESDKGGGPDQTITKALILNSTTEYPYAKECKVSKKVSATSLALAGLHLGMTSADAEKARARAPSLKSSEKIEWLFVAENKAKLLSQDLEASLTDDKVTSVSIWKH